MTSQAYIGIGSNTDRKKNLVAALRALKKQFGELRLSSIYESEPIGMTDAENYYNLVAGFETRLSLEELNRQLKKIERDSGRRQKSLCPLDLDLLLYDDLIKHKNGLDIPRRDIIDYAYVAVPLAEINGDSVHPETGQLFNQHSKSDQVADQKIWRSDFQLLEET